MRLLVSSCSIGTGGAADHLLALLRQAGHEARHSPTDGTFGTWYEHGLHECIDTSQVAIIVVDSVWDSSTWMGIEADAIHRSAQEGRLLKVLVFIDPGVRVHAKGMVPYIVCVERIQLEGLLERLNEIAQQLPNPIGS